MEEADTDGVKGTLVTENFGLSQFWSVSYAPFLIIANATEQIESNPVTLFGVKQGLHAAFSPNFYSVRTLVRCFDATMFLFFSIRGSVSPYEHLLTRMIGSTHDVKAYVAV